MLLLDRYLPAFSFRETHWHDIPASQSEVMAQALAYRPGQDAFFRRMIGLREIPMRVRPGLAKLVLGFAARPIGDGMTRLSTETRVACTSRAALLKFAPY